MRDTTRTLVTEEVCKSAVEAPPELPCDGRSLTEPLRGDLLDSGALCCEAARLCWLCAALCRLCCEARLRSLPRLRPDRRPAFGSTFTFDDAPG